MEEGSLLYHVDFRNSDGINPRSGVASLYIDNEQIRCGMGL